jgi:hypothetical protein
MDLQAAARYSKLTRFGITFDVQFGIGDYDCRTRVGPTEDISFKGKRMERLLGKTSTLFGLVGAAALALLLIGGCSSEPSPEERAANAANQADAAASRAESAATSAQQAAAAAQAAASKVEQAAGDAKAAADRAEAIAANH